MKPWDLPFIVKRALGALEKHLIDAKYTKQTYADIVRSSSHPEVLRTRSIFEDTLIPINLRNGDAGGTYNLPFLPL